MTKKLEDNYSTLHAQLAKVDAPLLILFDLIETCGEILIENGICSYEAFHSKFDEKILKDFGAEKFAHFKQAAMLWEMAGVQS